MKFEVIVSPSARADLVEYADYIASDSKTRAREWVAGAVKLILSLSVMPQRFPKFEPLSSDGQEIRCIAYFSHLIFFQVELSTRKVKVLRIWHVNRRFPNQLDLD